MKTYTGVISELSSNQIFVFGSNTQGKHGKGAALWAKKHAGAKHGNNSGFQGQSYAIITKNLASYTQPSIDDTYIIGEIVDLYIVAKSMPYKEFMIAYTLAPNLNDYTPDQMAKMFADAANNNTDMIPENIIFHDGFANLVKKHCNEE